MYRSATVDYVRPFFGIHRQAGRGIVHFLWRRNFRRSLFRWHRCSLLLSWRALCEVGISMLCQIFLLLFPLSGLLVIRWCIWRSSVFAARLDHVQTCEFVFFPLSKLWCWDWRVCNAVGANNHTLGRDNEFLLCSWSTEDDVLFQTDFVLSFWHIVVLVNRLFSWLGFLTDSFSFFPFFAVSCPIKHCTSLLPSKIDKMCLVLQPFEEYAAAAVSWSVFLWEVNLVCCCCSRMQLTTVLNFW